MEFGQVRCDRKRFGNASQKTMRASVGISQVWDSNPFIHEGPRGSLGSTNEINKLCRIDE